MIGYSPQRYVPQLVTTFWPSTRQEFCCIFAECCKVQLIMRLRVRTCSVQSVRMIFILRGKCDCYLHVFSLLCLPFMILSCGARQCLTYHEINFELNFTSLVGLFVARQDRAEQTLISTCTVCSVTDPRLITTWWCAILSTETLSHIAFERTEPNAPPRYHCKRQGQGRRSAPRDPLGMSYSAC